MTIFTVGFTQKSAEKFFGLIKDNSIELLLDIRLNNKSQLAGFTKSDDLSYFLREIAGCKYLHAEEFAPTKELMEKGRSKKRVWEEFEEEFTRLLESRGAVEKFNRLSAGYENICLLCSEPKPEDCHRSVAAKLLSRKTGCAVVHL